MLYRLGTYPIILTIEVFIGTFEMFDELTNGKVERSTLQFEKLLLEAQLHLDEISKWTCPAFVPPQVLV